MLISVIVPVYNAEKTLRRCVQSLLSQTYSEVEVILVNDGSEDNSISLCRHFSSVDMRVKVINQKNSGVSASRNRGMEAAAGAYIGFLDADDYVEPNLIEAAVAAAAAYGKSGPELPDVIMWGHYNDFVDSDDFLLRSVKARCGSGSFDLDHIRTLPMTAEFLGHIGYCWNKLYKRDMLLHGEHVFDEKVSLYEDLLFNAGIFGEPFRLILLDGLYTHYIQRPRNTLGNRYRADGYRLRRMACDIKEDLLKHWNVDPVKRECLISRLRFDSVGSVLRGISGCEELSGAQKQKLAAGLLAEESAEQALLEYRPRSIKESIVHRLLKSRRARLLFLLYRLTEG